jgi:hypothetical protein
VPRFVDLSLFYFAHGTDGYMLWGEGLISSERGAGPSVSASNLGNGLRVLRVTNDLATVTKVLQDPVFNYRHKGTTAIQLGLKRRPPIVALPPWGTLGTTATALLHQFVRPTKAAALGATPVGQGDVPREVLDRILLRAHEVVGVDFRGADARYLGDVVLIEDASMTPPPLSFTSVRGSGAFPEAVRFDIEPHARDSELSINLRVIGTDDAVLDDVLVQWTPGMDTSFVLATNQRFGAVELRVWRDGRLIWMTHCGYILEVGLNAQLVSGTVVLNDRLTNLLERAIQAGNAPASALPQARIVTQQGMSSQSMVGANLREPWRQAFLSAKGEVFMLAPPAPPPAEYFPQGGGGRAAAILAFVKPLQEGSCFLVDPFFDAFGAADLLPRIAGDVDLTVITSLPDDEERSSERLVAYLHEARGYLPHGVKVRRVTRSNSNEQAFHDRYLVVLGGEGPPRGFLLSNSFSGLARKYPLVVAEMNVGTTGAVLEDIQRMLASKHVDALWPPPPPGPYRHDAFGVGWQWYLSRLLSRGGRDVTTWLAVAAGAGWLMVDGEGNPRWSTERQEAVLDRLFPRRSGESLRRPGRQNRRRLGRRLPPLGFRVAAIGERVARGLEVQVADVVARLGVGDARRLGTWLRTSFRSPDRWERHGHWRTHVSVRQALLDPVPTRDRVRFGLSLWSDTHVAMDLTREYGRAFAYRVMLILNPTQALAVGVELGDPTFVAAALDWWHIEAWHPAVSRAALSAASAMVKALGVQSLAAPTTRGDHSPVPEPPSAAAVPGLLCELADVDGTVVAFACLEWAPRVDDANARLAVVVAMVERLPQLSSENLRDVAAVLLGNADLLAIFSDALPIATAGRVTALEAVTAALGSATSGTLDDHRWGELAKCASTIAAIFLAKHGGSYDDARGHLHEVLDLASARTENATISPFRRHPAWRRATCMLAFAQVVLLNLRARSREDVDVEVGPLWSLVAEASPALHAALLNAVREL